MRQKIEGIDCFVGMRTMPTYTFDLGIPAIYAAGAWAGIDADRANRPERVHMLCDNVIHTLHGSFGGHALRAAFAFLISGLFARLEQEANAPGQFLFR